MGVYYFRMFTFNQLCFSGALFSLVTHKIYYCAPSVVNSVYAMELGDDAMFKFLHNIGMLRGSKLITKQQAGTLKDLLIQKDQVCKPTNPLF